MDAGLIYWEMGKREVAISLYQRAADLGDLSGQCNLGISYLQSKAFISFFYVTKDCIFRGRGLWIVWVGGGDFAFA